MGGAAREMQCRDIAMNEHQDRGNAGLVNRRGQQLGRPGIGGGIGQRHHREVVAWGRFGGAGRREDPVTWIHRQVALTDIDALRLGMGEPTLKAGRQAAGEVAHQRDLVNRAATGQGQRAEPGQAGAGVIGAKKKRSSAEPGLFHQSGQSAGIDIGALDLRHKKPAGQPAGHHEGIVAKAPWQAPGGGQRPGKGVALHQRRRLGKRGGIEHVRHKSDTGPNAELSPPRPWTYC